MGEEWVGIANWLAQDLQKAHSERDVLRARAEAAEAMLRRLQWLDMGHAYPVCPVCERHEREGHAPDCDLGALLAIRDAASGRGPKGGME